MTLPGGDWSNLEIGAAGFWGSWDDYQTIYMTGSAHFSGNLTGAGALVIDGDFELTGQFNWTGIVIVLGDMKTSGGGSGIHIYGATMIQGGGGLDNNTSIGGNADLLYSSEAISRLSTLSPYSVYNWREL